MPEPTNIATEAADDDLDLRQCEHCDKSFPIETMTMMEDCWFCEACAKEWRAIFDACAHEWRPYTNSMGDEGRICDRCNGFVAHEDAEVVLGATQTPESPAPEKAEGDSLSFLWTNRDELKAFSDICFIAMRNEPEFRPARQRLSFEDLKIMSDKLAGLMLRWQAERTLRKESVELATLRAAIAAANARCERMRRALEPFAKRCADFDQSFDSTRRPGSFTCSVQLGDLRAARDAAAETGDGRG